MLVSLTWVLMRSSDCRLARLARWCRSASLYLGIEEVERLQAGEVGQVVQAGIADLGRTEVERLQAVAVGQVLRSGIADLGIVEVERLQAVAVGQVLPMRSRIRSSRSWAIWPWMPPPTKSATRDLAMAAVRVREMAVISMAFRVLLIQKARRSWTKSRGRTYSLRFPAYAGVGQECPTYVCLAFNRPRYQ